jgi:hypothetical protein
MAADKVIFVPGLFGSCLEWRSPRGVIPIWDGDYVRFAGVLSNSPDLVDSTTRLETTGVVERTSIWGTPHEDIYKTLFEFIRGPLAGCGKRVFDP